MSRSSREDVRRHTLPLLPENGPASCPASVEEVLRHVRSHITGTRRLTATDLHFVRTAQADERRYWVWRFPVRGAAGYALVMQDEEATWLSCQTAPRALDPERVVEADLRTWLDPEVPQGHGAPA
jgi:hypothetical protein